MLKAVIKIVIVIVGRKITVHAGFKGSVVALIGSMYQENVNVLGQQEVAMILLALLALLALPVLLVLLVLLALPVLLVLLTDQLHQEPMVILGVKNLVLTRK